MRVIICRIMKEGTALLVTGNDVIKGVVELQRGVQSIVANFKSHT